MGLVSIFLLDSGGELMHSTAFPLIFEPIDKGHRGFREGSKYRLHLVGRAELTLEATVSFIALLTKIALGPAHDQSTHCPSQPHGVMTCLTPRGTDSQRETMCDVAYIIGF